MKIRGTEIQELMDGCWQTLAAGSTGLIEATRINSLKHDTSGVGSANMNMHSNHQDGTSGGHDMEIDMVVDGNMHMHDKTEKERHRDLNATSGVVSHIFSGVKPCDICVEGMPVGTIRKLTCRQISMALQILLQMFLLSDDTSECFNKCYTSIMELSNLREAAVKKAKLMGITLQNLSEYRHSMLDLKGKKDDSSKGDIYIYIYIYSMCLCVCIV